MPSESDSPCATPKADPLIDSSWLPWIEQRRLKHHDPEAMVRTMVAAGVDLAQARLAVRALESDRGYQAALSKCQLHDKLVSVVGNLQKVWEIDPRYRLIEKRPSPSADEFLTRYIRGCRPVVLADVARDWPALRRWTPAYLKERFGHLGVEVQADRNSDELYELHKRRHRRQTTLGDFVDRVLQVGVSNDEYLTAANELLRRVEFAPLLSDVGTLPPRCVRARLADSASLWFGPAGTVTPLHHDPLMLFHTQVTGRKRWRLVSPLDTPRLYNHLYLYSPVNLDDVDLQRYPDFRNVKVLDVVLEPGETLFLPLGWWHQVTSLEVSISLAYSNLDTLNEFEYEHPGIVDG